MQAAGHWLWHSLKTRCATISLIDLPLRVQSVSVMCGLNKDIVRPRSGLPNSGGSLQSTRIPAPASCPESSVSYRAALRIQGVPGRLEQPASFCSSLPVACDRPGRGKRRTAFQVLAHENRLVEELVKRAN